MIILENLRYQGQGRDSEILRGEPASVNTGTYLIVMKIDKDIEITRPKRMILKKGYYAYVGSAMNSLIGRLKRHLIKGKKIHWHIDQLTERGEVVLIIAFVGRKIEEEFSESLSKRFVVVERFDSSDLKVKGNLFFLENLRKIFEVLKDFHPMEREGDDRSI